VEEDARAFRVWAGELSGGEGEGERVRYTRVRCMIGGGSE
jgi:hypothetical protein